MDDILEEISNRVKSDQNWKKIIPALKGKRRKEISKLPEFKGVRKFTYPSRENGGLVKEISETE